MSLISKPIGDGELDNQDQKSDKSYLRDGGVEAKVVLAIGAAFSVFEGKITDRAEEEGEGEEE